MVVNGKPRFAFLCLRVIADPPFGDARVPINRVQGAVAHSSLLDVGATELWNEQRL